MPATVLPMPIFTAFDDDGAILPGALLYAYAAGTTTPLDTYSDAVGTPNTNPVECDAAGRAVVYLSAAAYKFVLGDADGNVIWTRDQVASVAVGQSGALGDVFVFGGDPSSPIIVTDYPSGATYDKLHAGSSIYSVNSALLLGTYALEAMILGSGFTVTVALVNLSDGAPDTPIATCVSTSTAGARVVSSAITAWGAAGVEKTYGLKVKVSDGSGYVWGVRLTRIA